MKKHTMSTDVQCGMRRQWSKPQIAIITTSNSDQETVLAACKTAAVAGGLGNNKAKCQKSNLLCAVCSTTTGS
jgi:hypothetical protein